MTIPGQRGSAARRAAAHLLTPQEVAAVFRVNPKTISRWENDGKLPESASIRTPGGHRRFHVTSIVQMLVKQGTPEDEAFDMIARVQERV